MDRKIERVLMLYTKLTEGRLIKKQELAWLFDVNIRTIQRDIDDIRCYYSNHPEQGVEIIYDRKLGGYQLRKFKGLEE